MSKLSSLKASFVVVPKQWDDLLNGLSSGSILREKQTKKRPIYP